jgi:threonine/homoserine/homoserine lactone efflux protein
MSALARDVLSFAVLAGLLTIVPGLDTAVVIRSTVAGGRRHGFATALGVGTGALLWGVAAAVGISALLVASTAAYTVVRLLGAVYLVWMGSRLLVGALGRGRLGGVSDEQPGPTEPSLGRSWRRGLLTNLLNPKVGAFYLAVLPQFIPAHASHLLVGLLLALVHDLEGLVWFTAIVTGAHGIRGLLARRRTRRAVDAVTGATLVGFGLRLATTSR